jgi:hypothetical protein
MPTPPSRLIALEKKREKEGARKAGSFALDGRQPESALDTLGATPAPMES